MEEDNFETFDVDFPMLVFHDYSTNELERILTEYIIYMNVYR